MNYIETKFICTPCNEIITDILIAGLAEMGYESFQEDDNGVTAYITEDLFTKESIDTVITDFPLEANITYTSGLIIDKNWNEEWEKNYFKPLVIVNRCIIKSTFHQEEGHYDYTILIDPKMSFGTGHHQTTELMIREILGESFEGKSVLDMGCGTAILAILASMRGAGPVLAIDIDEWAYENAKENLELNNIHNVEVCKGGAELLDASKATFDIILANINRNILLHDINSYTRVLNKGGLLYMSGFYTEDIPAITTESKKYGMELDYYKNKDNWAVVRFKKIEN